MHPDHKEQLTRLKKIQGQVGGIARMIEEGRYCVDILTQFKAIKSALAKVELAILERHLDHCVKGAIHAKNEEEAQTKMDEIMQLIAAQK